MIGQAVIRLLVQVVALDRFEMADVLLGGTHVGRGVQRLVAEETLELRRSLGRTGGRALYGSTCRGSHVLGERQVVVPIRRRLLAAANEACTEALYLRFELTDSHNASFSGSRPRGHSRSGLGGWLAEGVEVEQTGGK